MGCYNTTVSWASKRGLMLDSRIERREVDGIYGMYARADIPAGEVIISYPINKLVQPSAIAPASLPRPIQLMVSSAVEKSKGEQSEYFGCFSMLESIDDLKGKSVFFFNQTDFQFLDQLNPMIGFQARSTHKEMHDFSRMIKSSQPDLEDSLIIEIVLNFVSRGWGNFGFIPVMDLFNHDDRKGATLKRINREGEDHLGWINRLSYKKGEQIFVSYSRKDIVNLATKYNYYDPQGTHYIDYAPRALQMVQSSFRQKLCQRLSQKYNAQFVNINGKKHFKLNEVGLFFTERAPSLKLIEYFRDSSFENEQQLASGVCPDQAVVNNLLKTIDTFLHANRVDHVPVEALPEKLHRFHYLLEKEQTMLRENRQWVLDNMDF